MALLTELKHWKNGETTLPDDNANIKALKYWLNGEPYVITYTEAAGGATLKSVNGLALASIKSINGLAMADCKSKNGLTLS